MSSDYRLVRTRRRTVALIVQADGSLVVRAPLRTPEKFIREFVESKSAWIRRKQAQAVAARPAERQYVDGEQFWFLGRPYPLKIVARQRPALKLAAEFRLARPARPRAKAAFVRWYKSQARSLLDGRVRLLADRHGYEFERIRISSARTRWGSCSSSGTLSFTYRLVMAPEAVIDYVIIHELVHLKIRNHSPGFWKQVAALMPDYKKHVLWLRQNGRLLTLDGG